MSPETGELARKAAESAVLLCQAVNRYGAGSPEAAEAEAAAHRVFRRAYEADVPIADVVAALSRC